MKTILIILFIGAGITFTACNKTKDEKSKTGSKEETKKKENINSAGVKENGHEFDVQYEQPRRIYKIEKEDLNNDGNKEIIVLSVVKDVNEKYNDYYNFDMIEIFSLNPGKNSYVKIFVDTVDYSKDCLFVDLANNKTRQILIKTNSGGNDVITSNGMFVFDMVSSDSVKLIKYFDSGAPIVKDLRNDGQNEILVSDLFYGVMPQINAITFIKEIYKLENQELVEKNSEFRAFYDSLVKTSMENYNGLKRKVEMGMQPANLAYPLYREAAEVIINCYAADDETALKKFWDEEKESLKKNIPENEFLDLNNFILKALPSAKNA